MIQEREVQGYLAQIIAQAMYMDESEVREDELFSNFGLESLTLVKLVAKVNTQYGTEIKPNEMLRHQTLRDAAAFVFREVAAKVAPEEAR